MMIVRDNIHFLHQALDLVRHCSPETFVATNPPQYGSGVGSHLRHCLDHYENLLDGIPSGDVNYDARCRDEAVATQPESARDTILALTRKLEEVSPESLDAPLTITMDCGSEEEQAPSHSTLRRELQFLVSHTVHHFALIAMILHDQGIPTPPDFGVAPSTIKFRQASAACAQ